MKKRLVFTFTFFILFLFIFSSTAFSERRGWKKGGWKEGDTVYWVYGQSTSKCDSFYYKGYRIVNIANGVAKIAITDGSEEPVFTEADKMEGFSSEHYAHQYVEKIRQDCLRKRFDGKN